MEVEIIYAFANKFLSRKELEKAIKKGMDNETIKEITDLDVDEIELIRKVLK